jgi:hypothetical protein
MDSEARSSSSLTRKHENRRQRGRTGVVATYARPTGAELATREALDAAHTGMTVAPVMRRPSSHSTFKRTKSRSRDRSASRKQRREYVPLHKRPPPHMLRYGSRAVSSASLTPRPNVRMASPRVRTDSSFDTLRPRPSKTKTTIYRIEGYTPSNEIILLYNGLDNEVFERTVDALIRYWNTGTLPHEHFIVHPRYNDIVRAKTSTTEEEILTKKAMNEMMSQHRGDRGDDMVALYERS